VLLERGQMTAILNYPLWVFVLTFVVLWLSAALGVAMRKAWGEFADDLRDDYGVILGATLTLLGLIIGFTFSMATTRYDQRKAYEEGEANAIGTEYVRADLLPSASAAQARTLLLRYTDLRIRFYEVRSREELRKVDADTAVLQNQLWEVVAAAANAQPSTNSQLAASGMNDVLNSQGYTQASWWNRIPPAAWGLMYAVAIVSHLLVGFGSRRREVFLSIVLPLLVAISFFLISDIDSPRGGVIRVQPQNLIALAKSFPRN
jgi:hypothetical protein